MTPFLDERRLLSGPWQAFERDIARLLLMSSYDEVRIVAGSNDHGADVLGVRDGMVRVVQCKHTTTAGPPKQAVEEVIEAGRFYGADRMAVAASRMPGAGFMAEIERYGRLGLKVDVLGPKEILEWSRRVPEYAAARRELRPYQIEVANAFREILVDAGRGHMVLATGLGKTVVMAEVVAELLRTHQLPGGRVLVLADKRELVRQLQEGFWAQLPKWVPTHTLTGDERPAFWEGITFATVQSALGALDELRGTGLVLIDEAHHVGSVTFQTVVEQLQPPMIGGATATPWRGDGYDIEQILGPAVCRIGIADGLREKFLSEVDYRLFADNIDWDVVRERSTHNYSLGQLNRRLILPLRDDEAARIITQAFMGENRRRGIVFCPTVEHAEHFAGILSSYGLRAQAMSAKNSSRERDKLMTLFRKGAIDVLTSVDLFNEGVDVPDVDLIVFMRATHSRRIFVQQLGRGLRTSPGKSGVIALDFVTDIRRLAEVIELERAAAGPVERLPLGDQLIRFQDTSAGSFMLEWMKDQASLILREGDPTLSLPKFDFPEVASPGGIQ
jgi:superfamily II DNA or RNA helicase/Holliday junction resolvase